MPALAADVGSDGYAGPPIRALQGIDRSGRVIYVGTFSKLVFPALRIGYVVLPEGLIRPFAAAKALTDTGGATLEQLALADFIREGHFDRHIRRSRTRNRSRRQALLAAIDRHLADRVDVTGSDAGLHVLLWVRDEGRAPRELLHRIEAAGVRVYPVAAFYASPPQRPGFLLGYASLDEAQIAEGVQRLAGALGPAARGSRVSGRSDAPALRRAPRA
jgi:GntR family transcriptional regulator/MocR family aminotransferase